MGLKFANIDLISIAFPVPTRQTAQSRKISPIGGTTDLIPSKITDDMQRQAAGKIDRGIDKVTIPAVNPQTVASQPMTDFKLKRGKRRCWSSGYLGQTKGGRWNIQR